MVYMEYFPCMAGSCRSFLGVACSTFNPISTRCWCSSSSSWRGFGKLGMIFICVRCHCNFFISVWGSQGGTILYGSVLDWYILYGPMLDVVYHMMWCPFALQASTLCCLLIMCMGRVWAFQYMYQFTFFSETFAAKMLHAFGVSWLWRYSILDDAFQLLFPCNAGGMFVYSYFATSYTAMGIISTLDVVVCCPFSFDETAPNVSAVAYANLCSWKKGAWKKKTFHQESFLRPILAASWAPSWYL